MLWRGNTIVNETAEACIKFAMHVPLLTKKTITKISTTVLLAVQGS
jgi:hypothetical protein